MPPDETTTQTAAAATSTDAQTASAAAQRPEGLPDRFWSQEKGVVQDELVKDVIERQKAEAERAAKIPANADALKVELPPTFKLPDGVQFTVDQKNPLFEIGKQYALEKKLTQDEFSELVAVHAKAMLAENEALQTALKAEVDAMGKAKYDEGRATLEQNLNAHIGPDGWKLFEHMFVTKASIEAGLKYIASMTRGGATVNGGSREEAKPAPLPPEERAYPGMNARLLKRAS